MNKKENMYVLIPNIPYFKSLVVAKEASSKLIGSQVCKLLPVMDVKPRNDLMVTLYEDGNTKVFGKEGHEYHLEKSWIILYAQFLEDNGIDPTTVKIKLSNSSNVRIIKDVDTGEYTYEIYQVVVHY